MKLLANYFLLSIFAICATAIPAHAQFSPDVYFGVGTAQAASNGQSLNTFGDGNFYSTPRLGGTFGKAGADVMITPHFGIGGEVDFRFQQAPYAGLRYRPTSYDFNGIWTPTVPGFRRVVPELQAGIGGMNLSFYNKTTSCDSFAGCSSSNQYLESSNHFQFHLQAGVRFYVTSHLYVKPQIDAHYVNNLFQFGSNWIPEYGASVGWSFRRE